MKAKLYEFDYRRKEDEEAKRRSLYVMFQNEEKISGIDVSLMTEAEKVTFERIVDDFEMSLAPYQKKYYRLFSKDKVEDIEEEVDE
jgi:hypothetical protein